MDRTRRWLVGAEPTVTILGAYVWGLESASRLENIVLLKCVSAPSAPMLLILPLPTHRKFFTYFKGPQAG